ncbi:MAG: hypothetical protein WAM14_01810 [Candidatus Nitrosopolaris sp.]
MENVAIVIGSSSGIGFSTYAILARNGFDAYAIQAQHISLFSHLQLLGSFKHDEHITAPHPTQVLLNLLQSQCSHSSMVNNLIRPTAILY